MIWTFKLFMHDVYSTLWFTIPNLMPANRRCHICQNYAIFVDVRKLHGLVMNFHMHIPIRVILKGHGRRALEQRSSYFRCCMERWLKKNSKPYQHSVRFVCNSQVIFAAEMPFSWNMHVKRQTCEDTVHQDSVKNNMSSIIYKWNMFAIYKNRFVFIHNMHNF